MSLSDLKIKSAKPKEKQYKLTDGDGLFLLIHPNGSKYWRFRYYFQKKEYLISLGSYPFISILEARRLKDSYRESLNNGVNPIELKKNDCSNDNLSFRSISSQWCQNNTRWSEPHRKRVLTSLECYLFPDLATKKISDITAKDLLYPIKNVENTGKKELASRLLQRANAIMRYAVQNGYINYNPAQDLLGCVIKPKVKHHPALEIEELPLLLKRIESFEGKKLTKYALQLSLLTFIRSSELRFARWTEVDLEQKIWTIPAEREYIDGVRYSYRGAKMRTAHIVPLSDQVISLFEEIKKISGQFELIFIGDHDPYKPMSENTINKALRFMGYDTKTEICGHGFRTLACSSLIESGLWSKDAVERQMSHQERNDVRAAYIHKAKHINERTRMVQWWADYLDAIQTKFIMPYEFKIDIN